MERVEKKTGNPESAEGFCILFSSVFEELIFKLAKIPKFNAVGQSEILKMGRDDIDKIGTSMVYYNFYC